MMKRDDDEYDDEDDEHGGRHKVSSPSPVGTKKSKITFGVSYVPGPFQGGSARFLAVPN